jgi:hypothetical protein
MNGLKNEFLIAASNLKNAFHPQNILAVFLQQPIKPSLKSRQIKRRRTGK